MRSNRSFIHLLSLVLCAVLVAGFLPSFALKADAALDSGKSGGCDGDHSGYTRLSNSQITQAGNYYLEANLVQEGYVPLVNIQCSGTVTLCLNGHNLRHKGNDTRVVYIEAIGGDLTVNLCDCQGSGTIHHSNSYNGIYIYGGDYNAVLNMYGGTIKDCKYGIYATYTTTINLYGGTIQNCATAGISAMVNSDKVNIYGGTITGNYRGIQFEYSDVLTLTGSPVIKDNTYGDLYLWADNITFDAHQLNVSSPITIGQKKNGAFAVANVDTGDLLQSFQHVDSAKRLTYYNGQIFIHGDSCSFIPATCTTPKTCSACGTIEEGLDPNNHKESAAWTTENEKHWKTCDYGCGAKLKEDYCSGGTATCTAKAICGTCGKEYGNVLPHSPVYAVKEGTANVLVETCANCDTHHAEATLTAIDKTYTGSPITDAASISYGEGWLGAKPAIDASCYSNNLNATTVGNPATVEVTLGGATLQAEFSIAPATIGNEHLTLSSGETTYTREKQEPTYSVSWNGMTLNSGTDYDLSWDDDSFVNAGTYTLTVVGKGNFQGTATAAYTIRKAAAPTFDFPTAQNEITYGQKLSEVSLSFYENEYGTFNWNAPDGVPNAGPGDYAVDFTPNDTYSPENYDFAGDNRWIASRNALCDTVSITVNKAEIPVPAIDSKPYSGTLQTADIPESSLYTATNEGGTDVGEYPVILSLANPNNYKWAGTEESAVNLTFSITQATNEGDIRIIGWTYGENPNAPACGLKFGEPVIRYTGTAVDGTAWDENFAPTFPGEYTISFIVEETENFTGLSKDVDFTIAKAPITVTADDASKGYGEDDPTLSGAITAGQVVEGDTLGFTYSREIGNNAGTYAVKAAANADNSPYYDVTFVDGTFTIEKAPLTIIVEDQTITYGEKMGHVFFIGTGFQYEDSFSELDQDAVTYPCDYEQYGDVGTYTINTTGWESDNYTISYQPGTLTVVPKEIGIQWSEGAFVYNGEAQAPTATATGMVNKDALTLTVTGAKTDAGKDYEATVTEIKGDKAGNYKLPADVTQKFEIHNADQSAPTVTAVNETISKKSDGKLTGLTSAMEYRTEGQTAYTKVAGTELTGLKPGKYFVRFAAKTNYNASPDTAVVINAGRKLTVTLPADQDGYTVTASATEFDWHDTVTITYLTADGYSRCENFSVKVNGKDTGLLKDGVREFADVEQDLTVTVTGVMDVTAPTATITLKDNWNKLWSGVTFGRFFNETQTFTITAEDVDTGSGLDKIYYYLSQTEIEDVQAITDWTEYTKPVKVNPDRVFVIYAKATDKAGNAVYVNSDGFVLDATAPAITGIENGKDYYGDTTFSTNDDNFSEVTVDGKAVTLIDGSYTIKADNRTHIIVATDKAGNRTIFTIRVYQIHTVTFVADGKVVATVQVNHGDDVALPTVPAKTGYSAKWNKTGKNILTDTTITAVYKALPSPNSPQTGDNFNIFFWVGLMLVTALGLAILAYKFFFAYKPKYQDK